MVMIFLICLCILLFAYFSFNIHKGNLFSFFVESLCGVGIRVTVASQDELGHVPSVSVLWNSLRSVSAKSSLKIW